MRCISVSQCVSWIISVWMNICQFIVYLCCISLASCISLIIPLSFSLYPPTPPIRKSQTCLRDSERARWSIMSFCFNITRGYESERARARTHTEITFVSAFSPWKHLQSFHFNYLTRCPYEWKLNCRIKCIFSKAIANWTNKLTYNNFGL